MTDYKQTRDVSGRVTSQYGQMLQNLSDGDDLVKQALAELGDVVRCRCKAAYTGRGMHDPDCECDSAEAVKVVANRINLLEDKLKDLDEAYDSIIHALRFEALRTDDAEAKLAKAVKFTEGVIRYAGNSGDDYLAEQARATLAELKGENDD